MFRAQIRPLFVSFILLTLVTGFGYPLLVTGIAQVCFKNQANGSILIKSGKSIGSELIGQTFDAPQYLWGRLSATSPSFNGASSSGSNYGPMNQALLDSAASRIKALKEADPENTAPIPVDLVTASGSGLDPHISLASADYQVARIAKARKVPGKMIRAIISKNTQGRFWGILGEPTVNVLKVNLDLDELRESRS